MPRYFLELAYRGTAYQGFQIQENAHSVQAEVSRALHTLFRTEFELTGSSRTDAGVHARQNFFHFDSATALDPQRVYNLNAILPPDIVVMALHPVGPHAHCRFDAVAREYAYYLHRGKDPFLVDRSWAYPYPLDLEALQAGAALLLGHQDFTSFSKRNTQVSHFNCQLLHSYWEQSPNGLVYRVKANRFLRGMVRGLVGTMLKLGRHQLDLEQFQAILAAKDCRKADFTTPPQGLFLEKVHFPENFFAAETLVGQGL